MDDEPAPMETNKPDESRRSSILNVSILYTLYILYILCTHLNQIIYNIGNNDLLFFFFSIKKNLILPYYMKFIYT